MKTIKLFVDDELIPDHEAVKLPSPMPEAGDHWLVTLEKIEPRKPVEFWMRIRTVTLSDYGVRIDLESPSAAKIVGRFWFTVRNKCEETIYDWFATPEL